MIQIRLKHIVLVVLHNFFGVGVVDVQIFFFEMIVFLIFESNSKLHFEKKVRNAPNVCQIGCFSPCFEKKVENAPQFVLSGAF